MVLGSASYEAFHRCCVFIVARAALVRQQSDFDVRMWGLDSVIARQHDICRSISSLLSYDIKKCLIISSYGGKSFLRASRVYTTWLSVIRSLSSLSCVYYSASGTRVSTVRRRRVNARIRLCVCRDVRRSESIRLLCIRRKIMNSRCVKINVCIVASPSKCNSSNAYTHTSVCVSNTEMSPHELCELDCAFAGTSSDWNQFVCCTSDEKLWSRGTWFLHFFRCTVAYWCVYVRVSNSASIGYWPREIPFPSSRASRWVRVGQIDVGSDRIFFGGVGWDSLKVLGGDWSSQRDT